MSDVLTFRKGQRGAKTPAESRDKALAYATVDRPFIAGGEGEFYQVGVFYAPQGTDIFAVANEYALRGKIQRFVDHFQREGWKLNGKVLVRRVPTIPDDRCLSLQGINESHPLREPDKDMYEVIAPFKRAPRPFSMLVDDSTARLLPLMPGWRLRD